MFSWFQNKIIYIQHFDLKSSFDKINIIYIVLVNIILSEIILKITPNCFKLKSIDIQNPIEKEK